MQARREVLAFAFGATLGASAAGKQGTWLAPLPNSDVQTS